MDPTKPAAKGLYAAVRRTLGIGVDGLSVEEKAHRESLRHKILAEAQPLSPEMLPHILPGLGPHPEAPESLQKQISIDSESVYAVTKKIVRGCEFWLGDGRIIEPPSEIEIIFPREKPDLHAAVLAEFARGATHLGPGLQIRRAQAVDDPRGVLYELTIWDNTTVYSIILPPGADA